MLALLCTIETLEDPEVGTFSKIKPRIFTERELADPASLTCISCLRLRAVGSLIVFRRKAAQEVLMGLLTFHPI